MCSVNGIKYTTIINGLSNYNHQKWIRVLKKLTKCDHCGADLETMKKMHSLHPKEREHIIREHMKKATEHLRGL